jgi:4-hydroxybenzoate polyprenyltransferase
MFGSWVFWVGCFYVCFPLGLLIYGWNDIVDLETDKHNPRKDSFLFGARVEPHQRTSLIWSMAAIQIPFLLLFLWLSGPKMLIWFALVLLTNAVYNAPGWGWKNRPGLDLINQAGYLLVFLLSSWLHNVPYLPWDVMLFSALFAMHSHLFGQLMDVDADRHAGRRTTAGVIGVTPGKWLLVAILCIEAAIVWHRDSFVTGFLCLSAIVFACDALFVYRNKTYPQWMIKLFFLGWNFIALCSMNWLWARGTLIAHP